MIVTRSISQTARARWSASSTVRSYGWSSTEISGLPRYSPATRTLHETRSARSSGFAASWSIRPEASEGLQGLAAVAAVHGDDHRAARLVGAATAHRYDHPQDPVEERLYARFLAPARTRYGTDRWDAATREGGALSFEDAIAFALQEPRA